MGSPHEPVMVHLYGALAEQFGAEHAYRINSPREAVSALCANHPSFRSEFVKYERYGVYADGDWYEGDDSAVLPVSREVHLVPIIEGRAFAVPMLGNIAIQIVVGIAISALMWGISQLFFKPEEETTEGEMADSYMFTGASNTTMQGAAIPVIYGRCYVGSVVVSAGLSTGDQVIVSSSQTLYAREDIPSSATEYMKRVGKGVPADTPEIVLQDISTHEGVPVMRLGPEGWVYVGIVTLMQEEVIRTVEVWVPPEAGLMFRWDYYRGFERWQPGETGLLET